MYDKEKNNYFEVIVSERVAHYYSEDLYNKVKIFLHSIKDEYKRFRAIACREQGKKEKKWHVHIACHFPPLFAMPQSTFRDRLRTHFGKSNTTYDWKRRKVTSKNSLENFFKYVFKDGDCIADVDFFKVFNKFKGLWQPKVAPTTSAKSIQEKIPIVRCQQCIDWDIKFCKKDCWDAVVKYYNDQDKVYDDYRMINLTKTLYYKEYPDDHWSKVADRI